MRRPLGLSDPVGSLVSKNILKQCGVPEADEIDRAHRGAEGERTMRRVMMSGFLMLAMGCATVGSVGVNTSSHGIWYQDCGVSRSIPGGTATFKGTLTSPNSAIATDEQQPPKSSNVKGTLRVIMPHPDTCNGKGVDLVELTEEALVTPSAAKPKMHRYKVESIPPARWAE